MPGEAHYAKPAPRALDRGRHERACVLSQERMFVDEVLQMIGLAVHFLLVKKRIHRAPRPATAQVPVIHLFGRSRTRMVIGNQCEWLHARGRTTLALSKNKGGAVADWRITGTTRTPSSSIAESMPINVTAATASAPNSSSPPAVVPQGILLSRPTKSFPSSQCLFFPVPVFCREYQGKKRNVREYTW